MKANLLQTKRRRRNCYSAAAARAAYSMILYQPTLQWERLPERQQRTQEAAAPCELGLSALHGQETAAHKHTHTQHCTQSSCCHNNPPCPPLIGTASLARQQQGLRRDTDTKKKIKRHNRQANILQETSCDWHNFNACIMNMHRATEQKKKWSMWV